MSPSDPPRDDAAATMPLTYADAGVDIEAGNALVQAISAMTASTARPGADAALGGFGALFDLGAAGYRDPLLVAATDGVGTKLMIAFATGHHESVGIDLVAMCVNDLIVQGAEPLFFLDYFATGRLRGDVAARVVAGVADGCRQAGCALIGGETAEMPAMYADGHYDLAGFAVGAVERTRLLPRADVAPGDVLIGLASNGLHSNGFSLVRRIVEREGLGYDDPAPFAPERSLGDALLDPTTIYVDALKPLLADGTLKAMAHITGGGLTENVPRVLPEGTRADFDLGNGARPAVFDWLQEKGRIDTDEMLRTFNCGIGMVLVVAEDKADTVLTAASLVGLAPRPIGRIVAQS